ncbi:DUF2290 domain-containing protein [Paraburkholderia tropica]|uniref:DUF2290 domain-containing protein n=1 Tax=Paraburkholderia tropica TaxID=92647 RepID=UPI003D2756E4
MYYNTFRPYLRYAGIDADMPDNFLITPDVIRTLRQSPYLDQWRISHENQWFHLVMHDLSFFVFDAARMSYSFVDRPIDVVSPRQYLRQNNKEVSRKNLNDIEEEYDLYLSSAVMRPHVTPIRFDLDVKAYRAGVHPAAHIHIGLENQVRLHVNKELTPVAFFLFVIRQMYPLYWERLCASNLSNKLKHVASAGLQLMDGKYCSPLDEIELRLS